MNCIIIDIIGHSNIFLVNKKNSRIMKALHVQFMHTQSHTYTTFTTYPF